MADHAYDQFSVLVNKLNTIYFTILCLCQTGRGIILIVTCNKPAAIIITVCDPFFVFFSQTSKRKKANIKLSIRIVVSVDI